MKILMLGGSQEARRIAYLAEDQPDVKLTVWVARTDEHDWPSGCEFRVGEIGANADLEIWLRASRFMAVIDATHPFATDMERQVASASQELGVDFIRVIRPEWTPTAADKWTFIQNASDAADHIPQGSCVFFGDRKA